MSEPLNPYEPPQVSSATQPTVIRPIRMQGKLTLDEARRVWDELYGLWMIAGWACGLTMLWLVVGGGALSFHAIAVQRSQPGMHAVAGLIWLLGMFAQGAFIAQVLRSRALRRLHAQGAGIFLPTQWDITDEGVTCRRGPAVQFTSWDDYLGYRIRANILLLKVNRAAQTRSHRRESHNQFTDYAVLPRSQFASNSDWHELMFLVQHKLWKI